MTQDYSREYFQEKGKKGGKTHNAKKSVKTIKEKYGKDFFSKIAKKKKK